GSQETITINVRLVCATNRDLQQEVKKGTFREDLFYRINVVPIMLPPLRHRQDDVTTLVIHFAQRFAKQMNREVPEFTPQAMDLLLSYPWPGNVRELEHAVERVMVTGDSNRINAENLPFVISAMETATATAAAKLAATAPRSDLGEKMEFEE